MWLSLFLVLHAHSVVVLFQDVALWFYPDTVDLGGRLDGTWMHLNEVGRHAQSSLVVLGDSGHELGKSLLALAELVIEVHPGYAGYAEGGVSGHGPLQMAWAIVSAG
jgi:hypothetical protein